MSITYSSEQYGSKFGKAKKSVLFARMADSLRLEGRIDEAIQVCSDGLNHHPHYLSGHLVLGRCMMQMEKLDDAKMHFEQALKLDPRCLSALRSLAEIHMRMQWFTAAEEKTRQIITLDPWDVSSRTLWQQLSSQLQSNPTDSLMAANSPATTLSSAAYGGPTEDGTLGVNLDSVADFIPDEDQNNNADYSGFGAQQTDLPVLDFGEVEGLGDGNLGGRAETPSMSGFSNTSDSVSQSPVSGQDVADRLDSLFDENAQTQAPNFSESQLINAGASQTIELSVSENTRSVPMDAGDQTLSWQPSRPLDDSLSTQDISSEDIGNRLDTMFGEEEESTTLKSISLDPSLSNTTSETLSATQESLETPTGAFDIPVVSGDDVSEQIETFFGTDTGEQITAEGTQATNEAFGGIENILSDTMARSDTMISDASMTSMESESEMEVDARISHLFEKSDLENYQNDTTLNSIVNDSSADASNMIVGKDIEDTLDALFGPDDSFSVTSAEIAESSFSPTSELEETGKATGFISLSDSSLIEPESDTGSTYLSFIPRGDSSPISSIFAANPEQSQSLSMDELSGTQIRQLEDDATIKATESSLLALDDQFGSQAYSASSFIDLANDNPDMESLSNTSLAQIAPEPFVLPNTESENEIVQGDEVSARLEEMFGSDDTYTPDLQSSVESPSLTETASFKAETETFSPLVSGDDVSVRLDELFPNDLEPQPSSQESVQDNFGELTEASASDSQLFDPESAAQTIGLDASQMRQEQEESKSEEESPVVGAETFYNLMGDNAEGEGNVFADELQELQGMELAEEDTESEQNAEGDGIAEQESDVASQPEILVQNQDKDFGSEHTILMPSVELEDETVVEQQLTSGEFEDEDGEEPVPSSETSNVATVTLAEIYFQQGLKEQSLQIYRQLLEREAGNEQVHKRIQEIEASKAEDEANSKEQNDESVQRRPRPGVKIQKRKT